MSMERMKYVQARATLLEKITTTLQGDERFVAAWLAGSFGRGKETWLSDLDLHVIVSEAASPVLCATPWRTGARTTEERLAVFSQFGTPGLIFERTEHANQLNGVLTNVVYQESSQNVDWMLIPQAKAYREPETLLLFDKVGLPGPPLSEPESPEQRLERVSTQAGFFWIIACGSARALTAGRMLLFFAYLLELENAIREVKAALRGEIATYTKHSDLQLATTHERRVAMLRGLCDEMERLMPQLVQMGGYVPESPRDIVEKRLALVLEDEKGYAMIDEK